ncbi:hypothetical protein Lal_00028176 [Lupinus albus]|nr:hypothetical protein Lal_00028176 [Lupinus albus]
MTYDKSVETQSHKMQRIAHEIIFEEEARRQNHRDDMLIFSNNKANKKFSGAVLKSTGNNFKNQNHNVKKTKNISRNKNCNPQKVQYVKPPAKNDSNNLFICFKCGKSGHIDTSARINQWIVLYKPT